jgi:hypothetical protein
VAGTSRIHGGRRDHDADRPVGAALPDSIVATGEQLDQDAFTRFAGQVRYVQGDFADTGTFMTAAMEPHFGARP